MIIEVRVDNCLVFANPAKISLKADMRNKKLAFNVATAGNINVLKSLCIYGPNNVGKTCFLRAIRYIKDVMLNVRPLGIQPNLFTGHGVCSLGITFLQNSKVYKFDFKFDVRKDEFVYERFSEIIRDKHGNEKDDLYLEKDTVNSTIFVKDNTALADVLKVMGKDNIAIYLIDVAKFPILENIKKILADFANTIDIINMNNIPLEKTIELLKKNNGQQRKIVNFIKNADLEIEDYKYSKHFFEKLGLKDKKGKDIFPEECALKHKENYLDQFCLVSVHKGKEVPSLFIDSTGTKKIVALASYVIDAIEQGRTLVIDELDSSLHFSLTRAIVALFNNEINKSGQLIFSAHDISLLDCKKLFRKEQIWFIYRTKEDVYVYSLADFTARKNGTRDTSDIMEHYKKGLYGALPRPDLISTLGKQEKFCKNVRKG